MAGLVAAGKNLMLDSGFTPGFLSVHSADPGATGTSELTGGSPAYARKAITWGGASAGVKSNTNSMVFDIPPGGVTAYVAYWSASTAGTYYGSRALSATETFVGQGTLTVAAGDLDESL